MWTILEMAALFPAALATGDLMVNWIGLTRAMRRLRSAPVYTEVHQATDATFDPYMPIVVVGAITGSLVLALSPSPAAFWAFEGAVGYAFVLVFSLLTNVRINTQVARWSVDSPPSDWAVQRARWRRFRIVRTLVSVPALVFCFLAVTP